MSLPQEVTQEIFQVIEGGSSIGTPAQIIQFPSDNGQNVYNVVQKTYQGTNGTAFNYFVVAVESIVSGAAAAVSAGAAILTLPLAGPAGAIVGIAAALGLTTGYVLYEISPEFWNDVAEDLINAGETIGGKLVAMMDDRGVMTYSPEAIEIIKNKFLEYGAFNVEYICQPSQSDIDLIPTSFTDYMPMPIILGGKCVSSIDGTVITGGYEYRNNTSPVYDAYMNSYPSSDEDELINFAYVIVSLEPFEYKAPYFNWASAVRATYNELDFYWAWGNGAQSLVNNHLVNNYQILREWDRTDGTWYAEGKLPLAYLLLKGIISELGNVQPNAILPDSNPFPQTYPDWVSVEFPEIDPHTGTPYQIPDRYPIEYPDNLPDEEDYQDEAQDPDADSEDYPDLVTSAVENPDYRPIAGQIHPVPEPEPIDPDPQPIPDPEPIDPDPEPIIEPDPIDPIPDPIPTPIIPEPPLPDTVDSNKLFTVYNPSSSQLDALGGYLWDASIIAAIRDIWQEPMDGLISLQQVFVTPSTSGNHNIILGFLDSGVSSPVVSDQFVTVDCGTVEIKERKKNATDYAPYTSLHLYLPFIGIVELDSNECMDADISVTYKVDVYTGTCLAQVSVTRTEDMPNDPILYTFSGNCSQQLPLTSGNSTGVLSALLAGVSAGVSIASGGGLSTVAGYHLAGSSLTHEMMHVSHSGNISANAGIMGQKKPYVIIGRRHCYDANNYNSFYGFPANKTVFLGNHTGYCKVKKCWIKTSATQAEYEEIMRILEEDGVFV